MKKIPHLAFLLSLLLLPCLAWPQTPALPPATLPALSSKPTLKDGLSVTVNSTKAAFAVNDLPKFTVLFKNVSNKTFSLFDVDWYWSWTIRFEDQQTKGPWQLHNLVMVKRSQTPPRLCKPGQTVEVTLDLGKNSLPHDFTWQGDQSAPVAPLEQLPPGKYRLTLVIPLENDLERPEVTCWTGTLTTEPLEFAITDQPATTQPAPAK